MKVLIAIMFVCLCGCGQTNSSHRESIDSIRQKPNAEPREQNPGTPGPMGTDSTRPVPPKKGIIDSTK